MIRFNLVDREKKGRNDSKLKNAELIAKIEKFYDYDCLKKELLGK